MESYARLLSHVTLQVCILVTPCVVLGQVIVGRSPTVSTSPVVHAVSQTVADSLLTANLTAATAAISTSAKGVARYIPPSAHLSWGCFFDLGLDPLVV